MKIGRNDPCWCSSGKKYKKCHIGIPNYAAAHITPSITEVSETPEYIQLRQKIDAETVERRKHLEKLGIYIDFVTPTIFKGVKYWDLGSRLYYRWNTKETFHEFIVIVLAQILGEKWRDEQNVLQTQKQHFLFTCFEKYDEWKKKSKIPENCIGEIWKASPDGYAKTLLSLAFDICSLLHNSHLSDDLLVRLKNKAEYQSVRYEIGVAAIFARLGYKIEFLNEKYAYDKTAPHHTEFNAINPNGDVISVEAKSKHRHGVLHFPGTVETGKLTWGNVQKLYRDGLSQNPNDKPFIIFIDINALQSPKMDTFEKPWVKDVLKYMKKTPLFTKQSPNPYSAIVFTNYSYHYQEKQQAEAGEGLLQVPMYSKFPVKDKFLFKRLLQALSVYGDVPNLDIIYQT